MKHTLRIIFFSIVLMGGALYFGYWAHNRFNQAFTDIDTATTTVVAHSVVAHASIPTLPTPQATPKPDISTPAQPETPKPTAVVLPKESTKDFAFTAPTKGMTLYQGCTYTIAWSPEVSTVAMALVDAGTREHMGPVTSGIPKTVTGAAKKSIEWKVGSVWPGQYYILTASINDAAKVVKSGTFDIESIPKTMTPEQAKSLCTK